MKLQLGGKSLIICALLTALSTLCVLAQDDRAATPTANAPSTQIAARSVDLAKPANAGIAPEASQPAKPVPSAGVADILKMLDAGVSKDVVKVYVENTPVTWNLTATDIIALKDRGVSDDITTLLLKRSSESRAQTAPASAGSPAAPPASAAGPGAPAPEYAGGNATSGMIDPESYDYFRYYYLLPRTLAYTYQTLGYNPAIYSYGYNAPYAPYSGYGYGYGYGHPRHFYPRANFAPGNPNRPFQPFPAR